MIGSSHGRGRPPIVILAPHRSFTSVVCSMLGQHPALYGLPETNLFVTECIDEWLRSFRAGHEIGAHGTLRAIAEIHHGAQTPATIEWALRWLRASRDLTTASVIRRLSVRLGGRMLVDKSPPTAYRIEYMQRALREFPEARFLHLVRHPHEHGRSVCAALADPDNHSALPRGIRAVLDGSAAPGGKASFPGEDAGLRELFDFSTTPPTPDPSRSWYRLHTNILAFLRCVPTDHQLRLRGEDLLAKPDEHLRQIADWLQIPASREHVERMKHPERSPFAGFGPHNARLGNDPQFLKRPVLQLRPWHEEPLEAPVPWRADGAVLSADVKSLARHLGYGEPTGIESSQPLEAR